MAETINMPVVVGGVKWFHRLIPGVAGQLAQSLKQPRGWERQIIAEIVTFLHLKGQQRSSALVAMNQAPQVVVDQRSADVK